MDDLLQEIRLRIWKAYMKDRRVARPKTYITKVVSSVLINEMNRQIKEKQVHLLAKYDLIRNYMQVAIILFCIACRAMSS